MLCMSGEIRSRSSLTGRSMRTERQTGEWTDMTKLIVAFRSWFEKAPKNEMFNSSGSQSRDFQKCVCSFNSAYCFQNFKLNVPGSRSGLHLRGGKDDFSFGLVTRAGIDYCAWNIQDDGQCSKYLWFLLQDTIVNTFRLGLRISNWPLCVCVCSPHAHWASDVSPVLFFLLVLAIVPTQRVRWCHLDFHFYL